MVQSTVADVVRPAITTDDPDASLYQDIGHTQQIGRGWRIDVGQALLQFGHALTLRVYSVFIGLVTFEQTLDEFLAKRGAKL
jgi:hypothetical protein